MGVISWIIMGALAGWIASMFAGTNAKQGAVGNVVVGILGAFVGGWLMNLLGQDGANLGTFNLYSFLVATGGAILLLVVFGSLTRK